MPTSIMSIVQSPLEPKLGFDLSIPNLPATIPRVGMPTTSLQVQPLTRYLLNYYITPVSYTHLDVYKRQDVESAKEEKSSATKQNLIAYNVLGLKRNVRIRV